MMHEITGGKMRGLMVIALALVIIVTVFSLAAQGSRTSPGSASEKGRRENTAQIEEGNPRLLLPEAGGKKTNAPILIGLGLIFIFLGTMCPEK